MHPDYNETSDEAFQPYDIAVLTLVSDVAFNDGVQPICAPAQGFEDRIGEAVHLTGWGATSEDTSSKSITKLIPSCQRFFGVCECDNYYLAHPLKRLKRVNTLNRKPPE